MYLTYHGGKCCGVKHIMGLSNKPSEMAWEKNEATPAERAKINISSDAFGNHVSSADNRFFDGAPAETYGNRLRRIIRYVARYRPSGIIEVVIAYRKDKDGNNDMGWRSQAPWIPELEKIGFRHVTEALNSNSGQYCNIWHLVTLKGKIQMPDGTEVDPETFKLRPSKEETLKEKAKKGVSAASAAFPEASLDTVEAVEDDFISF